MKSILVLTPFYSPNVGGVETHLDDLTAFLQSKKFNQTIITYQPLTTCNAKAPFVQKDRSLTIYRLPWIKNNLFYLLESKPLLQLPYLTTGIFIFSFFYLLFCRPKIDVIHAHGLSATAVGLVLSKIFRKKLIISIHTIYKFTQRPVLAKICRVLFLSSDAILVLAQGAKDDLVGISVPAGKIYVYTNWVDLKDKFFPRDKEKCREKIQLDKSVFVSLFVGRLSPEKGVQLLLKTIPRVSKKITFLIVGGGPMKTEIEKAAKKFSNVRYVGPVSNESLPFYYGAADVLFWGSVDQDYFGRVTMGALGSGLPVLIPSKTEYFGKLKPVKINFSQGEIGYMLDPDPKLVAKKMNELTKDKKLRKMQSTCRKFALKNFSEKNADIFLSAYNF